MHGWTCGKQALVRSPSSAKLDWRTSGIESCGGRCLIAPLRTKTFRGCACYLDTLIEKMHDVAPSHQPLDVPVQSLIFSDTDASLPICKLTSASPERRSRATIMKSLSGCSNWSAFCTWAMCWLRVCSTRETQRLYTGSQYGRKPSCKAVATLQQTLKNIFLCQTKVFMRHF